MTSNYRFSIKIINFYYLNNCNRFVNEFILFVSFSILELLVGYLCRTFCAPWSCIRLNTEEAQNFYIIHTRFF